MRVLAIVLMLCVPQLCSASQVYTWVDKDGVAHYSDIEPAKLTATRKTNTAKDAKPLTPEQQAAKDKTDKNAAKKAACDTSKQNLATISNANNAKILMDLNKDGKPQELTPEQRKSQTDVLKAEVTINCTQ